MYKKIIHLPGINGLRAIAALSVVFAHINNPYFTDFNLPFRFELPLSEFGVTLFFVISGFLITFLLLLEKESSVINIKKFYYRRILRIWPIYYLFIIIALVTAFFIYTINDIYSSKIVWYLFFAANIPFINSQGIKILVHYWSIGVEEQFYLIWPWIVKLTKQKLLIISVSIFMFLFLMKLGSWYLLGKTCYLYQFINVTRFHCMMVGAIGAILLKNKNEQFVNLLRRNGVQIISWIFFFLLGFGIIHIPAPIAHESIALLSLIMIIGQVTQKTACINLEQKIPDFIGKISYGIYVYHPLVILLCSSIFSNLHLSSIPKYIFINIFILVGTLLIAAISYEYFEKPFLKLKSKYSMIYSINSMKLQ